MLMYLQERERRRQHLMLIKALEQRKRQEEKQQQRQAELEVAMELKKPVEDMELKNAKPLPDYPRLKSRLPGRPIADCLMVVEFLNNFGVALNLDKSSLPTLESLERGLLNDCEEDVEDFMWLVMHLLRIALDDVGVPNPKEAVTKLNQKITEMEMTDSTMSEILRIFVKARGEQEMSEWLSDKPMEALNATKKAAFLAFLCNELLTSKVVACEIDKHMDAINNLRRDKWIVEGQLRQLRVFQARKFNKIHKSTDRRNTNTAHINHLSLADDDTMSSSKMESDDEDDDDEEDSGNESDGSSSVTTSASINSNSPFEPVDENLTREESDKRIEKLRKQHAAYRQKVFRASLRLRAVNIGQDRYKRTYWVLPLTGGVYVEGLESGVPQDFLQDNDVKKEQIEKAESLAVDKEMPEVDEEPANIKSECENTNKITDSHMCNSMPVTDSMDGKAVVGADKASCEMKLVNGEQSGDQHKDVESSQRADVTVAQTVTHGTLNKILTDVTSSADTLTKIYSGVSSGEPKVAVPENFHGVSCLRTGVGNHEDLCNQKSSRYKNMTNQTHHTQSEVNTPDSNNVSKDTTSNLFGRTGCTELDRLEGRPDSVVSFQDKNILESHVHQVSSISPANSHPVSDCPHRLQKYQPVSQSLHKCDCISDSLHKCGSLSDSLHKCGSLISNSLHKCGSPSESLHKCGSPSDSLHKCGSLGETCQICVSKSGMRNNKLTSHKKLLQGQQLTGYAQINSENSDSDTSSSPDDTTCISPLDRGDTHDKTTSQASITQVNGLANGRILLEDGSSQTGNKGSEDILRIPQMKTASPETLASVVNYSIYQAYHEDKQEIVRTAKPLATCATDSPTLLSSSLLFSAISSLPQSVNVKHNLSSAVSLVKPETPATDLMSKHTSLELTSQLLASTPVPAHSKNPQPLPPFHPSAQASPLLDLTPPAAHTGNKSSRLSSHPHQSTGPSALPHLPQSPYTPGLPHHPYGPCSASETLSSLASIISPPPAHYHPPLTAASTSALLLTPPLRSTSTVSKTSNTFVGVDAILKGDSLFSSSELLQQAASQVLRHSESKKQAHSSSPSTPSPALSHMTADDFLSMYTPSQQSPDKGNKHSVAEVVDHGLWFSVLPRMPCDELSVSTQIPSTYYQQMSSPLTSSVGSYLTPTSGMCQESLVTSLRLLTTSLSHSPTSASDFVGEFKVPQPPDSNPHSDPWDLLRAAQGEAQPIPKDKQHGWWRIYDTAMLKSIMSCTLSRGIREKNLQRAIHRYLDYAQLHCTFDSDKGETDPDLDEGKSEKMKTTDTVNKGSDDIINEKCSDGITNDKSMSDSEADDAAECLQNADDEKMEVKKEDTAEADDGQAESSLCDYVSPDDPQQWSVKCMHEIELAALEEVEALEERIFQASLQAKQGWRPHKDASLKIVDRSKQTLSNDESYPLDVGISRLLELEANIERRYLKPPLIRSVQLHLTNLSGGHSSDGDFGDDENIPPGLLLWRQAVVGAESPAQLSLCTQLLAKSISWEKSIMRVTCQICRKDDNEAELLLCDGCDKGYHTYCFKPKMDNIPEGDWYCFECVSKVSGTPHCVVCGTPGGKMVSCQLCPRYIHLECADPPLPRMPKRWQCLNCIMEKGNSKKSKKRKEKLPTVQRITIAKLVLKEEPLDDNELTSDTITASSSTPYDDEADSKVMIGRSVSDRIDNTEDSPPDSQKKKRKRKDKETLAPPTPKKKEKPTKKERKVKERKVEEVEKLSECLTEDKKSVNRDLSACGKLLTEMEKHEDGWPFLKPVSKKQFPSYKKYIQCPMDFSTARSKLKAREYKHRQDFAADMRLIFTNCQTFNEDDSQVGQAGFSLGQFFERRWLEIFPDDTAV